MIEVDRVLEKIDGNPEFRKLVFSDDEIAFCEPKPNRGEHYAARFAAKEAFLKATGFGLTLGFELAEIEVVHDEKGRPRLKLNGKTGEKAIQHQWNSTHLSISHLRTVACAVVVIEQ